MVASFDEKGFHSGISPVSGDRVVLLCKFALWCFPLKFDLKFGKLCQRCGAGRL